MGKMGFTHWLGAVVGGDSPFAVGIGFAVAALIAVGGGWWILWTAVRDKVPGATRLWNPWGCLRRRCLLPSNHRRCCCPGWSNRCRRFDSVVSWCLYYSCKLSLCKIETNEKKKKKPNVLFCWITRAIFIIMIKQRNIHNSVRELDEFRSTKQYAYDVM